MVSHDFLGVIMPHDLLTIGVGFWSVVLGGAFYFARRFVRVFERHRTDNATIAALQQRIAALEDSMDGVRDDVERLSDGQEFTTRLLGSRSERGERQSTAD
jgi:hypothetical protein